MIQPGEAQRARAALSDVLDQIDGGEVEATRSERAVIAGAASALDAAAAEPPANSPVQ